jgi:sarcosine oxidase subunit gamma
MLERRSALASVLDKGGRAGADGRRRLTLGERRGWSLTQIAGFPSTLAELDAVAAPLLGASLPMHVGEAVPAGGRQVLKTRPEQFWILGPDADEFASQLQSALAPEIGSVTPLSHSRTCIVVEGEAAQALLAKGIPLDFHPEAFRIGQFAQTGLHHTPVLVWRSAGDRYEIFALRTFALSLWEWLADAALPLGYEFVG